MFYPTNRLCCYCPKKIGFLFTNKVNFQFFLMKNISYLPCSCKFPIQNSDDNGEIVVFLRPLKCIYFSWTVLIRREKKKYHTLTNFIFFQSQRWGFQFEIFCNKFAFLHYYVVILLYVSSTKTN